MNVTQLVHTTCESMLAARALNASRGNMEPVTLHVTYAEIGVTLNRLRITTQLRSRLIEEFKASRIELLAFDAKGLTLRTMPEGPKTSFSSLQELQQYGK